MTILDTAALNSALVGLQGWEPTKGGKALAKRFLFTDFNEAFGWMTRVAMAAEAANHHPDWRQSYKVVNVSLTTHSEGGLTENDLKLARLMDEYAV